MSFRTDRFFHPASLMMLLACGALGASQQSCIDHALAESPPLVKNIKTVKTVKTSKPLAANVTKKVKPGSATAGNRLMYTTYFYTANEAVIHGYEHDTNVRIISMSQGGTVWKGKVKAGETKLIPTGKGAFSFVSDKKASILVGTPSRCAVVGYWVRDREGVLSGQSRVYSVAFDDVLQEGEGPCLGMGRHQGADHQHHHRQDAVQGQDQEGDVL